MGCRLETLKQVYPPYILELFAPYPCSYCGVVHEVDGYTKIHKMEDEENESKIQE